MQMTASPLARGHAGLVLLAVLLAQLPLILNPGYFSHDELQWAAAAEQGPGFVWLATDAFQYRPLTFNLWTWLSRHLFAQPQALPSVLVAWGAANAALLLALARRFGVRRPGPLRSRRWCSRSARMRPTCMAGSGRSATCCGWRCALAGRPGRRSANGRRGASPSATFVLTADCAAGEGSGAVDPRTGAGRVDVRRPRRRQWLVVLLASAAACAVLPRVALRPAADCRTARQCLRLEPGAPCRCAGWNTSCSCRTCRCSKRTTRCRAASPTSAP